LIKKERIFLSAALSGKISYMKGIKIKPKQVHFSSLIDPKIDKTVPLQIDTSPCLKGLGSWFINGKKIHAFFSTLEDPTHTYNRLAPNFFSRTKTMISVRR